MGPSTSGGGAGARKSARTVLDDLMGKDRNKALTERKRRKNHFSDEDYCKFYLCGFCPYLLFTNTKSDLGVTCNLNHSDVMRESWDKLSDEERASYRYEDEFQAFLEERVRDVERKIQLRKSKSEADLGQLPPPDPEMVNQKQAIEQEIETTTEEMDRLNEEGRFEDAKTLMMKVEQLQQDVKKKAREIENKRTLETGKILGVCDICGVLIGIGDEQADARHLVGKQHLGYEQIRNKLKELRETQERRRELRRQFREKQADRERRVREVDDVKEDEKDKKRDIKLEERKDYNQYRYRD
ncbi:Luc7-like protein [Diplonema papillatum]|nr:Luc7-like protein [Diplonema papillatum]